MITLPYNIVCGYCDCSEFGNLHQSPKRKAQKFEIEFYLEDALSTFADNKKYRIKKHHIQIAKPGQMRYSLLPFKTLYLKFSVENDLAERLQNTPDFFHSSHPEKTIEKLNEILLLSENESNDLLLQSRLLSFLNLVLHDSKIPDIQSGQSYEIISNAKRYIEANYSQPIHLKDIADSVNLSPIYFHHIFTAACGISPHDYLTGYRIDAAKKQLWNTGIPLGIIAENCGFGCQQYFNKVFKKQTGTTPGQYRKAFQHNYWED